MHTEIDNHCGLVKTYWNDIRERVKNVDTIFTKLVDELNPDRTFPIYMAYLPYGELKGDTVSTLFPKVDGGNFRITDSSASKDVQKHLGYSKSGSPFGMVLEKELEYFIDLKSEGATIPWAIYDPGKFFSFSHYLSQKSTRVYSPNTILTVTSGARSAFMLPNIGCSKNHMNLQRTYNIDNSPPKSLYDQWDIFKEISKSKLANCDWKSCVLYFSNKWLTKLCNDKAWLPLKLYLYREALKYYEYEKCRSYYDIVFSSILKHRNLKPNPYLTDTARHLFATALGDAPGFAPAIDEQALPLSILQKAFVDGYGLKKYLPTIMQPSKLIYEKTKDPVYYSLQNPSTFNSSPKSRKITNTLLEMRELQHIMKVFLSELKKDNVMGADTVMGDVAQRIDFNYFHNILDRHNIIKPSTDITKFDKRFNSNQHAFKHREAVFAEDAPFIRGCISIKTN